MTPQEPFVLAGENWPLSPQSREGTEATVSVFGRNIDCLRELDVGFGGRANTVFASTLAIEEALSHADL